MCYGPERKGWRFPELEPDFYSNIDSFNILDNILFICMVTGKVVKQMKIYVKDAQEPIALIDMDDTLCDHTKALMRDLNAIAGPNDPPVRRHDTEEPDYIRLRKQLIRCQPDWWFNLEVYRPGFDLYELLQRYKFQMHVLTKGPWSSPNAWSEKVRWCRKYLDPEVKITITADKGLVYGKVLVDDYPKYIESWLKWRPRGLVIMPTQPHNEGFSHPNLMRYTGENLAEIEKGVEVFRSTLS